MMHLMCPKLDIKLLTNHSVFFSGNISWEIKGQLEPMLSPTSDAAQAGRRVWTRGAPTFSRTRAGFRRDVFWARCEALRHSKAATFKRLVWSPGTVESPAQRRVHCGRCMGVYPIWHELIEVLRIAHLGMIYTIYFWWFGGCFSIVFPTLFVLCFWCSFLVWQGNEFW